MQVEEGKEDCASFHLNGSLSLTLIRSLVLLHSNSTTECCNDLRMSM